MLFKNFISSLVLSQDCLVKTAISHFEGKKIKLEVCLMLWRYIEKYWYIFSQANTEVLFHLLFRPSVFHDFRAMVCLDKGFFWSGQNHVAVYSLLKHCPIFQITWYENIFFLTLNCFCFILLKESDIYTTLLLQCIRKYTVTFSVWYRSPVNISCLPPNGSLTASRKRVLRTFSSF